VRRPRGNSRYPKSALLPPSSLFPSPSPQPTYSSNLSRASTRTHSLTRARTHTRLRHLRLLLFPVLLLRGHGVGADRTCAPTGLPSCQSVRVPCACTCTSSNRHGKRSRQGGRAGMSAKLTAGLPTYLDPCPPSAASVLAILQLLHLHALLPPPLPQARCAGCLESWLLSVASCRGRLSSMHYHSQVLTCAEDCAIIHRKKSKEQAMGARTVKRAMGALTILYPPRLVGLLE
jgi:hypothetical protein